MRISRSPGLALAVEEVTVDVSVVGAEWSLVWKAGLAVERVKAHVCWIETIATDANVYVYPIFILCYSKNYLT